MQKRISGEQLRKSLKLNTNLINDEYFIFKLCNGCILCTHGIISNIIEYMDIL